MEKRLEKPVNECHKTGIDLIYILHIGIEGRWKDQEERNGGLQHQRPLVKVLGQTLVVMNHPKRWYISKLMLFFSFLLSFFLSFFGFPFVTTLGSVCFVCQQPHNHPLGLWGWWRCIPMFEDEHSFHLLLFSYRIGPGKYVWGCCNASPLASLHFFISLFATLMTQPHQHPLVWVVSRVTKTILSLLFCYFTLLL